MKIVNLNNQNIEESWDSGLRAITSCPYMTHNKMLLVSKEVIDMGYMLSQRLPTYEWLLYCEADEDETSIRVHDCLIPPQKVSYGTVEVKKGMNLPVVIHSHHNMKLNKFSGTDDEYINSNHDISMLWTDDGGIVHATVKKKLPCGHIALVEVSSIMVYIPQGYSYGEIKAKVDEQIKNVEKETYTYTYGGYSKVYPGYGVEYIDEAEREFRKLTGGYYDEDPWWERWQDEEDEPTGEDTPKIWRKK